VVTVKLLTIGEFARAARLSPKALRLYDELGLLRPARVDEWSGYRYYAPGQLERARLVAWLRRVGLPEEQARMAGTPDLSVLDARAGDRYLLTSDGLTNVVPDSVIRQTVADPALSPSEVVRRLIALANEAGGPDNIAVALADVTPAA